MRNSLRVLIVLLISITSSWMLWGEEMNRTKMTPAVSDAIVLDETFTPGPWWCYTRPQQEELTWIILNSTPTEVYNALVIDYNLLIEDSDKAQVEAAKKLFFQQNLSTVLGVGVGVVTVVGVFLWMFVPGPFGR